MIFKIGECREVVFWVLLLGSWQCLASPGSKTGIIGAVGTTAFLVYARANLGRLRGLGLDHARWCSTARSNWVLAAVAYYRCTIRVPDYLRLHICDGS
jgi:hypothetical protein